MHHPLGKPQNKFLDQTRFADVANSVSLSLPFGFFYKKVFPKFSMMQMMIM